MMVAVVVVAVDSGVIRWAENLDDIRYIQLVDLIYLGVVPLSLLTFAAIDVALGLVKFGRAPAFLTGYLLVGGLASFVTFLFELSQLAIRFFEMIPDTVWPLRHTSWDTLFVIAILVVPQVAFGVAGGALAARLNVTMVIERKEPVAPSTS